MDRTALLLPRTQLPFAERDHIDSEAAFAVITSRSSFEMVLKAATIRIPILVAVSAPTTMALRIAEQTGITLVPLAVGQHHYLRQPWKDKRTGGAGSMRTECLRSE
jgi:FdhD/NarQ family protein